jgi:hypothetical protein
MKTRKQLRKENERTIKKLRDLERRPANVRRSLDRLVPLKQKSVASVESNTTIDLHGYHPADIVFSGVLDKIVRQAWEMGAKTLTLIHGHGRNRGISPGFVNTNTGYFGLTIRRAMRHHESLRRWIYHTSLDCGDTGRTSVNLKKNAKPTRRRIDCLPKKDD